MNDFYRFLSDQHAKQYQGLDDDMPDDFQGWMANLTQDELIQLAELYKQSKETEDK